MDRPHMTLENEVTNYLHHFIKENDNPQGKKRFPCEARDAIRKLTSFYMRKGELLTLKKFDSKNPSIAIYTSNLESEEKELREFYRRDEILGT